MKTIIAGSRTITDYVTVRDAIFACDWWREITEVVSGGARGVDTLGELWATHEGIPWRRFKPNYPAYGRNFAPKMRNDEMAQYADALILVWDGKSGGSMDMLARAKRNGLRIYEHIVTEAEVAG